MHFKVCFVYVTQTLPKLAHLVRKLGKLAQNSSFIYNAVHGAHVICSGRSCVSTDPIPVLPWS